MNDVSDASRSYWLERGTQSYRRASLALFVAGFATFSALYGVQPLMPVFSRQFDVSPAVSSLSLSISTAVLAFTLLLAGLMSQAIDRKRVMGASVVFSATLSIAAGLAPGWYTLLAARALEGIALGGVPALALAYLSEEIRPSDLGGATGLYIAGTAVGGMGGRVIAGLVADLFGWRTALVCIGLLGFAAAAVFFGLLPHSRNFNPRRGLSAADHIGPLIRHLRHGALPWVFFCGFAFMGSFVTVYNYLGYRLSLPPFSLGQGAIGMVFIVYILGIAASATFGRVADRIGRPPVMVIALVLMSAGLGLMSPSSLFLIVPGISLLTIGFFAAHAIASGWVGLLAEHGKGHAAGLYLLSYYLGSSVIGSVGGLFWSAYGWPGVAGMVAALLATAVLAVARLNAWQRTHADAV